MKLYENIRLRREELKMSQQELADKLGYTSRSTITKIESGENDLTQSKIEAFAKALKISPIELMGYHTEESSKNTKTSFSDFPLSAHEKKVITAYRQKPEMQSAVDTLLNVSEENTRSKTAEKLHKVQIAARNGNFEEVYMSEKEIEEIINLPDVPLEDLL